MTKALIAFHIVDTAQCQRLIDTVRSANDAVLGPHEMAYVTHAIIGYCGHVFVFVRVTGGYEYFVDYAVRRDPNCSFFTNHHAAYGWLLMSATHTAAWFPYGVRHDRVMDAVLNVVGDQSKCHVHARLLTYQSPDELRDSMYYHKSQSHIEIVSEAVAVYKSLHYRDVKARSGDLYAIINACVANGRCTKCSAASDCCVRDATQLMPTPFSHKRPCGSGETAHPIC